MNEDELATLAALYLRQAQTALAGGRSEATVRALGDALRTLIALVGPTTVALGLAPFGAGLARAQKDQRALVAAASPAAPEPATRAEPLPGQIAQTRITCPCRLKIGEEPLTEPPRSCSYGGGVQSTALLVLAAQGTIDFPLFLFANVGDDSEHPATLDYVREVAVPFAAQHEIELVLLDRRRRDGTTETLFERLTREGSRSIPIPLKMSRTGAPGTRSCTADFKVRVISAELRRRGATRALPAVVALSISLDEIHRARSNSREAVQTLDYPLIRLRLDRGACAELIRGAGLPVPPKSSCWYCPYHSNAAWQRMRQNEPELFARSVALEQLINDRRAAAGRTPMYLHNRLRPLALATSANHQHDLFEDSPYAMCESGYCMT